MRALISVFILMAIGCGGDGFTVAPVTGKVTLDGKELSAATVTFTPVTAGSGSNAVGSTDASGTYKLTDMRSKTFGGGAEPGQYKVSILWSKAAGPDTSQSDGESVAIENASAANAVAESIPAAYRSADTSGLTAEVKKGDNVFDFALTKSFKGAGK